jgi:LysM repeat protein
MPGQHTVDTQKDPRLNSFWRIAEHYGVSFQELKQINEGKGTENGRYPYEKRKHPYGLNNGDIVILSKKQPPDKELGEIINKCVEKCPVEIRIIDDGGSPTNKTPTVKSLLEVSNRITTDELPTDYVTPSVDRDNFKIDVRDTKASGSVIAASKVEIEILKSDLTSFSPKRTLNVELNRVGSTDWFRSKYLRLVVDEKDKAAASSQTILADWDPSDYSVEILGQIVRARYTSSSGQVEATAEVGKNRTWIDVAVHVMRKTPGNDATGVVTTALATENMNKWFRRIYAQINMAPRMIEATRYIDPLENLIAISDNTGYDAAGGGPRGISFKIRVKKSGQPDKLYPVGTHKPNAGDSTKKTAETLAKLINDDKAIPLSARVVQNPPALNTTKGSADVIITDTKGGRVAIEALTADDPAQTVTVGRVTPTNFLGFAYGTPMDNWVVGSIQQRTVLQNYDTGKDRIDIVVIDTFRNGHRGQAMIPGTIYPTGKQAIDKITMSAFVNSHSMKSIDNDPNNCAHECGHVMLDAIHVTGDRTQLMTGNGTTVHYNVDASKRISELGVTFNIPASTIVQETRIRSKGSSVLSSW